MRWNQTAFSKNANASKNPPDGRTNFGGERESLRAKAAWRVASRRSPRHRRLTDSLPECESRFGLRWQSTATTPLSDVTRTTQT